MLSVKLTCMVLYARREHGGAGSGEGGAGAGSGEGGAAEDDDDDEVFGAWNLRKASAEALDMLSNNYGDDLLPVLLPIVQQRLQVRPGDCTPSNARLRAVASGGQEGWAVESCCLPAYHGTCLALCGVRAFGRRMLSLLRCLPARLVAGSFAARSLTGGRARVPSWRWAP